MAKFDPKYKKKNRKFDNKGKNNSKPKNDSNKPEVQDGEPIGPDPKGLAQVNDVSWYSKNPALLESVGKLSFGNPLGATFNLSNDQLTVNLADDETRIPGIAVINTIPGPGEGHNFTSAANIAARNIYSFVRHANSGHSNYDSVDLMLYLLAMDEAFMHYYRAIRAYGAIFAYNMKNRYAPKALVQALGFNFDDLTANLAQFRYAINAYAARLNSFAVPANMPIYKRHSWLFNGVYTDDETSKAQLYLFNTPYYRIFDPKHTGGGALISNAYPKELLIANWIDIGNKLLEPIVASEDLGIMSGDILKAFGTSGLLKLDPISENYSIVPTYTPVVLDQIHNLTAVGAPKTGTNDITQDPQIGKGNLMYMPAVTITDDSMLANRLLDFNKEEPTPEDIIEGTRLQCCVKRNTNPGAPLDEGFVTSFGSEFVQDVVIFSIAPNPITKELTAVDHVFKTFDTVTAGTHDTKSISRMLSKYTKASKFKSFPLQYLVAVLDATTKKSETRIFGELSDYTIVNRDTLHKLHDVCVLSLFDVPIQVK